MLCDGEIAPQFRLLEGLARVGSAATRCNDAEIIDLLRGYASAADCVLLGNQITAGERDELQATLRGMKFGSEPQQIGGMSEHTKGPWSLS